VQVVPQLVRAQAAPVAVLHSEVGALGPHLFGVAAIRLHDIENNSDPVFVLVSHDAFIRVGSIALDEVLDLWLAQFWRDQRVFLDFALGNPVGPVGAFLLPPQIKFEFGLVHTARDPGVLGIKVVSVLSQGRKLVQTFAKVQVSLLQFSRLDIEFA